MALQLLNLAVLSPRRLRLVFSNTLHGFAFTPLWFTVSSLDGLGVDPSLRAALIVPDGVNQLELALGSDLVNGGLYELHALAGIPSTETTPSLDLLLQFKTGERRQPPSAEVTVDDLSARLYQVDLAHDGTRFVEAPNGDIATVTGPENALGALRRRLTSSGLPWDQNYGAHPREYVDGPATATTQGSLSGRLIQQARADDRVKSVSVALPDGFGTDGEVVIPVTLGFIDGTSEVVPVEVA